MGTETTGDMRKDAVSDSLSPGQTHPQLDE